MEGRKKVSSKSFKIIISIVMVFAILISFGGGFLTYYLIRGKNSTLDWVTSYVDKYYCVLDENGNPIEFSAENYADSITGLLDKYSEYYTKEEYDAVLNSAQGNSYGIGVSLANDNQQPVLHSVVGNSPAEKAGLKEGDLVTGIEIDGQNTVVADRDGLFSLLDGIGNDKQFTIHFKRGEEVKSAILKKAQYKVAYCKYYDNQKVCKFVSEGLDVAVKTVEDSQEMSYLPDDTFYVKFSLFEGEATAQFVQCLQYAKERGKSKLILDVRNNGGGYLNILNDIASYLIKGSGSGKQLVLYSKDKNGKLTESYTIGQNWTGDVKAISVIANQGSASATECLIGAMLYYKDAFDVNSLVLEKGSDGVARTYGKGIMQTTYLNPLSGEALKLTTAYLFQPDGQTTIHGKGIYTTAENSVDKNDCINRAVDILKTK